LSRADSPPLPPRINTMAQAPQRVSPRNEYRNLHSHGAQSIEQYWSSFFDILLALKGRGFLLQDGDVPPRGYCATTRLRQRTCTAAWFEMRSNRHRAPTWPVGS